MTTPGCAPSTPAFQDPAVEVIEPFLYSAVSSPKYQTLPAASCAYQSNVSSARSPLAENTWSCTTVVATPMTISVRSVTKTTFRSRWPSETPSNTIFVPGIHGMYWLSTVATNSLGGGTFGW